jgi:quercetin dioxygenase-like cupin family protein
MRSFPSVILLLAQTMTTLPPGMTRAGLVENDSVVVARVGMAPGSREPTHTHAAAVVVQLGPGEVEWRIGTSVQTARHDRGYVEFVAAEIPHAAANVGSTPIDFITVGLNPTRKRGGEQPPTAPRADIARKQVLDNAEARVAHAAFQPGAREPVHTHPFDMVIVQLDPGRMEVLVGEKREARDYAVGEVVFLPRDVPHSVANVGTSPASLVSVTVK